MTLIAGNERDPGILRFSFIFLEVLDSYLTFRVQLFKASLA